jgi:predicted transcriptional regulator
MPQPRNPKKGVPTTARIHPEVLRALKRLGKRLKLKPSHMINCAVEKFVRTHGELKGKNIDR